MPWMVPGGTPKLLRSPEGLLGAVGGAQWDPEPDRLVGVPVGAQGSVRARWVSGWGSHRAGGCPGSVWGSSDVFWDPGLRGDTRGLSEGPVGSGGSGGVLGPCVPRSAAWWVARARLGLTGCPVRTQWALRAALLS